eukprot:snap_masked-scaffold_2-processed-gene-2.20-mRNA-1 protein AED:1.00 eAED:1.00 QI:0/-1/0/0/-1/1/1/0/60
MTSYDIFESIYKIHRTDNGVFEVKSLRERSRRTKNGSEHSKEYIYFYFRLVNGAAAVFNY